MSFLLDTDVAIHLRDANDVMTDRIAALSTRPLLSAISRVELENGVYRDLQWAAVRRTVLDTMLDGFATLPFDESCIQSYRSIVASTGYSRRKVNDRMIAATALAHDLSLITLNASDYSDIKALKLIDWSDA